MNQLSNTYVSVPGTGRTQLVSIDNPAQIVIQPIGGNIYIGDVNSDLPNNGLLLVAGQTMGWGNADFPQNCHIALYAVATIPNTNVSVRVQTLTR